MCVQCNCHLTWIQPDSELNGIFHLSDVMCGDLFILERCHRIFFVLVELDGTFNFGKLYGTFYIW